MRELMNASGNKAGMTQLSRTFGVSRSGLYEARQRQAQPVGIDTAAVQLQAAFMASGGSYGSRRLSAQLKRQGLPVGRHRARTLMRMHGLRARWRRKWVHTTDSRHSLPVAGNVLDRQFKPAATNRAWAGDITYIHTASGWVYLAVVIELYSRKVIGWAMAGHMQASLVCDALRMALSSRQPLPGVLMHTDRGSQYASQDHRELLQAHALVQSMSRKGNCWDNAVTERFFLNLKMERVWQQQYANLVEAQQDVTDYIVNFYNAQRLHSALGYRTPNEFEAMASDNTL